MNSIDYKNLRKDLLDYFGTALLYNPIALMELSRVERASNNELMNIALENGFNLNNYIVKIKILKI